MKELCYVMVKPGFVCDEVISETKRVMHKNGIKLVDEAKIKYDKECARLHYIEKQIKPYCGELIDYLCEDYSYGMVFEANNAVTKCREIVEDLRKTLKEKYNLSTDVMRNILHCSSKTKVGDTYLELDTQRELELFYYLKDKQND